MALALRWRRGVRARTYVMVEAWNSRFSHQNLLWPKVVDERSKPVLRLLAAASSLGSPAKTPIGIAAAIVIVVPPGPSENPVRTPSPASVALSTCRASGRTTCARSCQIHISASGNDSVRPACVVAWRCSGAAVALWHGGAHLHIPEGVGAGGPIAVSEWCAFRGALNPVWEHPHSDRLQLSTVAAAVDAGGGRTACGGWRRVEHSEHDPSSLWRIPVRVAILPCRARWTWNAGQNQCNVPVRLAQRVAEQNAAACALPTRYHSSTVISAITSTSARTL